MIPDNHFISDLAHCIPNSLKNRITEHHPDWQVISQQELRNVSAAHLVFIS